MGVKVASGCFNWSQPSISHSSSSSSLQTLASAFPSPPSSSKRRRSFLTLTDLRCVDRSTLFGKKLNRSQSFETLKSSPNRNSIRSSNSDPNFFSDEEFSKEIHELSLRFHLSDDDDSNSPENQPPLPENLIIERKANSVELPFSLRIIQKKNKKQYESLSLTSSYCSIKKAFSSMVFIIRELQSYTLQMREYLFFEDLQSILTRVHKEMNASFVWLFQQVFSHTPTLMVYVMILLANYSVHSMSATIAAAPPPYTAAPAAAEESVTAVGDQQTETDYVFFNYGNGNGGGGQVGPLVNGDGKFIEGYYGDFDLTRPDEEEEGVLGSGEVYRVEEWALWHWMVAEADKMMELNGYGGIDRETMRRFVAPVTVEVAGEVGSSSEDYSKTEGFYEMGLWEEPSNSLLLANYAQFLYLFVRDQERAESYFKRALEIKPKDAEALSKYASFLWHAKDDLWAAEETFLEAISVESDNSFYSASYANFLWSTGADDTCYPLN